MIPPWFLRNPALIGMFAVVAWCAVAADSPQPPMAAMPGNEVGATAVPFSLPSAQGGAEVHLGSFHGSKAVVLVFYRAFW